MRKLTCGMNLSVDGFIAAPGGDLGWSVPSDELFQWWSDRMGATGLALYGRKLWQTMSSHWPTADQQPGATPAQIQFARRWRDMPKVVFSSTTTAVDWNARRSRATLSPRSPGSRLRMAAPWTSLKRASLGRDAVTRRGLTTTGQGTSLDQRKSPRPPSLSPHTVPELSQKDDVPVEGQDARFAGRRRPADGRGRVPMAGFEGG